MKAIKSRPLRIYMGDITHDTIILVSDTIPINIGFIASYAKKIFGNEIEIFLYKYPHVILDAIKKFPPDVVALSNYSWNSNLSERVIEVVKYSNPDAIAIQGGSNFPIDRNMQLQFLLNRPNTDIFIESEGEVSFSQIIRRILDVSGSRVKVFDKEIPGCVFINPETKKSSKPSLFKGEPLQRLRLLDEIPSPYLDGSLDKFFDGKLTPFLETNRGCPFACSFCHTGDKYYNKMNMFSIDRVADEIQYIAPKMKELGIVNLHIADTNFGMFPRDKEICEMLYKSRKDYGWPLDIMSTTGKNQKDRIIEATQILGDTFSVTMSVQSMNQKVLTNIKRGNIKLDHYVEVNKTLKKRGRSTKCEIILGLPGETRESFAKGIKQLLDTGVSQIISYSLMLLYGTEFQDPAYLDEYKIQRKHRIVPLNFGVYEGIRVFDTEEVGVANKDMSFDDYLWARGLSFIVEIIHNSRPFNELFKYASIFGISIFEFIMRIYEDIDSAPEKVKELTQSFLNETRSELWDSEDELISHYGKDENYFSLVNGEVGCNIIYKHKAMGLSYYSNEWIMFLAKICFDIAKEHVDSKHDLIMIKKEINHVSEFVKNRIHGVLQSEANTDIRKMKSQYNFVDWKNTPDGTPLFDYVFKQEITYCFSYTPEQIRSRTDQFSRYGTDYNALSKIVTRVGNVENLFRRVTIAGKEELNVEAMKPDMFVRYTLSN